MNIYRSSKTLNARTIRDFAEERSHRDAVVSNESIRATSQATILINGGAATAILAYLSKGDLAPFIYEKVSLCLVGYGLGVFFAVSMMFFSILSLDFYNVHWRMIAFPNDHPGRQNDDQALEKARFWLKICKVCFWLSMLPFVVSTLAAAYFLSIVAHPLPPVSKPNVNEIRFL